MKIKAALVCFAALFHAITSQAAPAPMVEIDFSAASPGPYVSTDSRVSFSLVDENSIFQATPTIFSQDNYTGLGTSTSSFLMASFSSAVEDISFTFNSLPGSPSANLTPFVIYSYTNDSVGLALIPAESGSMNGIRFSLTGITGVRTLFFGNYDANNNSNPFSISYLQATVSAVPEPSAALMFGLGLTALLAARRRKSL